MTEVQGADSEVGQLHTVLMHRPGLELQRMTPRHVGKLLFGTLPWVSKAREEHDVLCERLRDQGVRVLYFMALLQDTLEYQAARDEAVRLAVADASLGDELRLQLRAYLENLDSERLAHVLIEGLTPEELRLGHGVVFELLDRHDFVLDPLPNLVFTKDSSFWVGDRVAVASLAPARRREADLAGVVYRHHPRFAGVRWLYQPDLEYVDGGDVLLLGRGVVAIGVGQRTTPAGTERLARRLFGAGLADTILAVPIGRQRLPGLGSVGSQAPLAAEGAGYLDTICTVIDRGTVLMHPAAAYTLTAHTIGPRPEGLRVSRAQPFLEAAAQALGVERVHVIDSGTEPSWGPAGRWDDGSNVLAIGSGVVVSHERNSETNTRLEAAGVRVIRVPSSELGSARGGPRAMTCAVSRAPAAVAAPPRPEPAARAAGLAAALGATGISVPSSREAAYSGAVPAVPAGSAAVGPSMDRPRSAPRGDDQRLGGGPAALAALVTPGRAPGRPAPRPDAAQDQDGSGYDQRDERQPHQGSDHGRRHEHDEDRGHDQQHDAKHVSTVRPPRRGPLHARGAGTARPSLPPWCRRPHDGFRLNGF
ncbi:MAG TPA: arginine deiminase family protein [Streptosporangiaceae bacterium]|nr:arginine deiminase family protein [Streptosporangiaceae bacterium]